MAFFAMAQDVGYSIKINVEAIFHGERLALHEKYQTGGNIEELKFFLSAFQLMKDGKQVWAEKESNHLLDVEHPESMLIDLQIPGNLVYDSMSFLLGIDSITSVSGAYGGALDPTTGMYWTWNSGYIHFKLAGTHDTTEIERGPFEYHLGGYLAPYATSQLITLALSDRSALVVLLDLDLFLNSIEPSLPSKVLSAGAEAKALSDLLAPSFRLKDE
jgi:hypothetical protein